MYSCSYSYVARERGADALGLCAAEKYEGSGMQFNGKLIGIMDVPELKGDKMCYEAMQALKAEMRRRGEHKPRIAVGVSFEGITIHGAPTGVRISPPLLSNVYSLLNTREF